MEGKEQLKGFIMFILKVIAVFFIICILLLDLGYLGLLPCITIREGDYSRIDTVYVHEGNPSE